MTTKWRAHTAEASRHSDDLALRADLNKKLAHLVRGHGTEVAVGLLRSSDLKFDELGGAAPLYNRGSQRAAAVHSHPATPADIRRQLPTSRRLLAKTDNTFEKPRRDGGIRTRGLLLPNQLHPDAGRSWMPRNVASTCRNSG
jgi:hypothetical protein